MPGSSPQSINDGKTRNNNEEMMDSKTEKLSVHKWKGGAINRVVDDTVGILQESVGGDD